MKTLVECLRGWLQAQHDDVLARQLALALVSQTLKRIDSDDATQRDFDAEFLAAECGWDDANGYESAKRRIENAKLTSYLEARRASLEATFRQQGFLQCLCIVKRSPSGRHRAAWSLETYDLPDSDTPIEPVDRVSSADPALSQSPVIQYDRVSTPDIGLSWIGRLMMGKGKFETRSFRSLMWLVWILVAILFIVLCTLCLWLMLYLDRPLQTRDLASLIFTGGLVWVVWLKGIRPYVWLLEDRVVPAPGMLLTFSEQSAQLELAKEAMRKTIGLVRYRATCPICAASVDLDYGEGNDRRRLFGRCDESPREHVFSFDRVTRQGVRLPVMR